ncbi:MAG: hypothetical protein M3R01_08175 [Actinomycetota bacterium]|nr:hypothetical protein [Actinomycetota bacterium]
MADPRLDRDFRAHGLRRRPWWRVVASWTVVVLSVPRLAGGPMARSAWLQRSALLCGRIVGSVRHRCLFP